MSTSAFVLVLTAAVLHAVWNAVVKASADRLVTTWAFVTAAALVNVPVLVVMGPPDRAVWCNVAVSAVIHVAYNLALVVAYGRADLSVAYPIARGTAPMLVTLGGVMLLADPATGRGVAGVALVSLSLAVLVAGRPMRHTTWAVVTGLLIATYTIVDGDGVRVNGDSLQYVAAVFVAHAVALTVVVIRARGIPLMREAVVAQPGRLLSGGTATAGAYLLVMIAARTEPLGLVAGLRETSALFGLAIGAVILKEPVTRNQTLAVAFAVLGTIAIATS